MEFIFESLWTFLGTWILLYCVLQSIIAIVQLILRHQTIRRVGYPPFGVDAEGDKWKEED